MVLAKKADKWRGFNEQAISVMHGQNTFHIYWFLIKLQNFIIIIEFTPIYLEGGLYLGEEGLGL